MSQRPLCGDASGRDQAASRHGRKPLVARYRSRSQKRGKALKREESQPVRSSHGCIARALSARRAREHAGKNRREHATSDSRSATQYVTFARCKCVVPHAISWSNGPRPPRLAFAHRRPSRTRTPREFFLLLYTDKREKNRTIIEAANLYRARQRADSDERNVETGK